MRCVWVVTTLSEIKLGIWDSDCMEISSLFGIKLVVQTMNPKKQNYYSRYTQKEKRKAQIRTKRMGRIV